MERDQIGDIVERVLGRIKAGEMPAKTVAQVAESSGKLRGVFKTVDDAAGAARAASQ